MNNKCVGVIMSIISFAPLLLFGQQDWISFSPPDKSFSVKLPSGQVMMKSDSVYTLEQKVLNEVFYIQMKEDHPNFLYMISRITYFEDLLLNVDSLSLEEFLESSIMALSESTGCKIQYQSLHSNVELVARLHDPMSNTHIKCRMLADGNQLYIIQVYTMHDNSLNDYIDLCIESFQLNH